MPESESFRELLRRVRCGDIDAADELWRQYEPLLRREMRLRLRDPHLRQRFDEDDICQSVMASFFVRATAGQFDLEGPDQLRQLLVKMGRNKLASLTRRHTAEIRDCRNVVPLPEQGIAAHNPTPSAVASWRELVQRFRELLSDEERQLADLRSQDQPWTEIVARLGGTVDGRRVQLNRAIARVSRELGLSWVDEETSAMVHR